jgi:hypothetical protein
MNTIREVEYMEEEVPFADVIWSNNPDPLFHMYRIPENISYLHIYRRVKT